MLEREVPEPFVVEPWWNRFGSTAMALLRQIAQRPTDPAPRLVLADFLEEAEESERAEFIRLQVREMPSRSNVVEIDDILLTVRERVLLARHRAEWLAGLPALNWLFWGVLVEGVVVSSEEQWQQARKYVDVRRLAWRGGEGFLSIVRNASGMRGVVALDLSSNRIGDARVQALAQSPHLSNLTSLYLSVNTIGDAGVQALAQSPHLSNLTTLDLSLNQIGATGVQALAQSPHLSHLTSLDLGSNRIGPQAARALAQSPYLSHLTTLNLAGNKIGAAGVQALAQSPHLSNLTTLDLSLNQIGATGVQALAQSSHLSNLIKLYLVNNQISEAGCEVLRNSPYLRRCKVII